MTFFGFIFLILSGVHLCNYVEDINGSDSGTVLMTGIVCAFLASGCFANQYF